MRAIKVIKCVIHHILSRFILFANTISLFYFLLLLCLPDFLALPALDFFWGFENGFV